MEFVIGGLAATSASVLTNPVEVVKHHMEISKKSQYNGKYKRFFNVGFRLAKEQGLKSLQKGLSPALGAHLMCYGIKLGTYQFGANRGITKDPQGATIVVKSICLSGMGGMIGQFLSNPFYLVKVQHYVEHQNINQDKKQTYSDTAKKIFKEGGVKGFFKGASTCIPRAFLGTSQLTSFAVTKEGLSKLDIDSFLATILASLVAGGALTITMTPYEVVLNKMYQKAETSKSIFRGYVDSIKIIYKNGGLRHFYKGVGPTYLKIGPHTMLCLVFWEQLKQVYDQNEFSLTPLYDFAFSDQPEYDSSSELHTSTNMFQKCDVYWN